MKIIVCVKQVPDTSGKVAVNPDGTLDRASMQTIINPDDMNAVEAALALKDQLGCPVIAVSMGPPPAAAMLLELKAMGVDRGVLVSAREFGGSDTFATSCATAGMSMTRKRGCITCRAGIITRGGVGLLVPMMLRCWPLRLKKPIGTRTSSLTAIITRSAEEMLAESSGTSLLAQSSAEL